MPDTRQDLFDNAVRDLHGMGVSTDGLGEDQVQALIDGMDNGLNSDQLSFVAGIDRPANEMDNVCRTLEVGVPMERVSDAQDETGHFNRFELAGMRNEYEGQADRGTDTEDGHNDTATNNSPDVDVDDQTDTATHDQDFDDADDFPDTDGPMYSDHVVDEDYVKEPDGRVADVTVFERPDGDGYDVESHPITANGTVLYGLDMDHEHYDTREEAESGMNDISERLEIDGDPESYDEAIEDSAYDDVGAYDGDPADLDVDNDSSPMYSDHVVDEEIVQEPDGRTVDVSVYERPDGDGYDVESHPVLTDGTVLYGIDMSHENFENKEDAESSMHDTADKLEIDGDAEAYDEAMEDSAYDIEDFESPEPDMADQDNNDFNDENDRIDSDSSGIDTDNDNRDDWDPDDDWDSIG